MLKILAALMALSVPTLVLARADCTVNPQSEWKSETDAISSALERQNLVRAMLTGNKYVDR